MEGERGDQRGNGKDCRYKRDVSDKLRDCCAYVSALCALTIRGKVPPPRSCPSKTSNARECAEILPIALSLTLSRATFAPLKTSRVSLESKNEGVKRKGRWKEVVELSSAPHGNERYDCDNWTVLTIRRREVERELDSFRAKCGEERGARREDRLRDSSDLQHRAEIRKPSSPNGRPSNRHTGELPNPAILLVDQQQTVATVAPRAGIHVFDYFPSPLFPFFKEDKGGNSTRNSNRVDDESAAPLFFFFNILDSIDIRDRHFGTKKRKCRFEKSYSGQFDYFDCRYPLSDLSRPAMRKISIWNQQFPVPQMYIRIGHFWRVSTYDIHHQRLPSLNLLRSRVIDRS